MPGAQTTLGQLLVNDALPDDLRSYSRTLDKKGLAELLREVATKHPDKYREISHKLSRIGVRAAYLSGGTSYSLRHLRRAAAAKKIKAAMESKVNSLLDDDALDDDDREEKIVKLLGSQMSQYQDAIFEESLAEGNPLATQVLSGARGNKLNLAALRGGDVLYTDHRDRVIPVPVLKSYSEGLTPAEYWAGAYGARKGVLATKLATRDAGSLSKQLNQIAHRLMVVGDDYESPPKTVLGFPVDIDDEDNEGALLAVPAGGYAKNTVLTPKVLRDLKRAGLSRLLVRSPAVGGSPDGGVYARDVGVREYGRLPARGEISGLTAAQALSEPLSQGQLSLKHSGGVFGAGKAVSGFEAVDQLVQSPQRMKGGATHAQVDGTVERVEEAPAGGQFVTINNERHYVPAGMNLKVKRGDVVEAGDVITDGVPHPSTIALYKGIGEARRYFTHAFREAYKDAGIRANRRNVELIARGLINHVRMTGEMGEYAPDDIVPYNILEHSYEPRDGFQSVDSKRAVGKYLERPYLHYSIGTKVRPSMMKDFDTFGVKTLDVHDDPPPFEPEMVRAMASLQHDPDWMTRMYGSGLKSSLLDAVHRGGKSDELGTSFVPGLARAVDFGRQGIVRTPSVSGQGTFKAGASQHANWTGTAGSTSGTQPPPAPDADRSFGEKTVDLLTPAPRGAYDIAKNTLSKAVGSPSADSFRAGDRAASGGAMAGFGGHRAYDAAKQVAPSPSTAANVAGWAANPGFQAARGAYNWFKGKPTQEHMDAENAEARYGFTPEYGAQGLLPWLQMMGPGAADQFGRAVGNPQMATGLMLTPQLLSVLTRGRDAPIAPQKKPNDGSFLDEGLGESLDAVDYLSNLTGPGKIPLSMALGALTGYINPRYQAGEKTLINPTVDTMVENAMSPIAPGFAGTRRRGVTRATQAVQQRQQAFDAAIRAREQAYAAEQAAKSAPQMAVAPEAVTPAEAALRGVLNEQALRRAKRYSVP